MSIRINYYKTTLHQLIDHIVGREIMGKPCIPSDPPYPCCRHLYLVDPEKVQELYVLLNCLNIGYYTNRFNHAMDIPDSQRYIPKEMFRFKPVEVLEEIDKRRLAFIKDILDIEYVGCLDVEKEGSLLSFNPTTAQHA